MPYLRKSRCHGDCAQTKPEAGDGGRPHCWASSSSLKIKHIARVFLSICLNI